MFAYNHYLKKKDLENISIEDLFNIILTEKKDQLVIDNLVTGFNNLIVKNDTNSEIIVDEYLNEVKLIEINESDLNILKSKNDDQNNKNSIYALKKDEKFILNLTIKYYINDDSNFINNNSELNSNLLNYNIFEYYNHNYLLNNNFKNKVTKDEWLILRKDLSFFNLILENYISFMSDDINEIIDFKIKFYKYISNLQDKKQLLSLNQIYPNSVDKSNYAKLKNLTFSVNLTEDKKLALFRKFKIFIKKFRFK